MPLWMLMPLRGRPVALRISSVADRPRRMVLDEADPELVREEWRCARCARWVDGDAVTWASSGKEVGNAPELFAYCAPCGTQPERRLRQRSHRP
jgi:hypothetical protein